MRHPPHQFSFADFAAITDFDYPFEQELYRNRAQILSRCLCVVGSISLGQSMQTVESSWARLAKQLTIEKLPSGHFVPAEAPHELFLTIDKFLNMTNRNGLSQLAE